MDESLFPIDDANEAAAEMTRLEVEYQRNKILPVQDDFSSGYGWAVFRNEDPKTVIGKFLSWEEFVVEAHAYDHANLLTDEDFVELRKIWDRFADDNVQFGRFYGGHFEPNGRLTSYRLADMLPLTQQQFQEMLEADLDMATIRSWDWVKNLIGAWSIQANAEAGANNPRCLMCGSMSWTAHSEARLTFQGPVSVGEGAYHTFIDMDMKPSKEARIVSLECAICGYSMDPDPEMPVHYARPPEDS